MSDEVNTSQRPPNDQAPVNDDSPWQPIVTQWLKKIELASKKKYEQFGEAAQECMLFFAGGAALADHMFGKGRKGHFVNDEDQAPCPQFRFTLNKVAEIVQLFGPTLYHRNPMRLVTPKQFKPLSPQVFQAVMQAQQPLLPPPPPMPMPVPGQAPPPPDPITQAWMQLQQMAQQQAAMAGEQDGVNNTLSQVLAELIGEYLNYTPNELNLAEHSRRVIEEALIKGMGCWWTEIYQPPGFQHRQIGSFYDTVDNLLMDPDAEVIEDCGWIVRRCTHRSTDFEDEYGLPRGTAPRNRTSNDARAKEAASAGTIDNPKPGESTDLTTYFKVYSKIGVGDQLTGVPDDITEQIGDFGKHVFLVVCKGLPYPANLHPGITTPPSDEEKAAYKVQQALYDQQQAAASQMAAMQSQMPGAPPAPMPQLSEPPVDPQQEFEDQLFDAAQWPLPLWIDGEWPMEPQIFHHVPNSLWPMPHAGFAMAELKFVNWCFSFLMDKVRGTCRTIVAAMEALREELEDKLKSGKDNLIVWIKDITGVQNINQLVSYLQPPNFPIDIYNMLDRMAEVIDKRLGLSEILYGMASTQSRSAEDTRTRQSNASIRVDDMAERVEAAMTRLSRKEAIAARYVLTGEDVAPQMGNVRAALWEKIVRSQDLEAVVRELNYRIEEGSVRKPNYQKLSQDANQMAQTFLPFFQQLALTGQVGPVNALIEDVCRANQIDPARYEVQPPPPPPPPMAGPAPGGPPHGMPPHGGGPPHPVQHQAA